MNTPLFVFGLALTVFTAPAYSESSEEKAVAAAIEECAKRFPNIPDERERLLLRHESLPENRDEKCVSECVMSHADMLKDGKMNIEGWREYMNAKWLDKKMAEKAFEGAQFCVDKIKEDDACELAAKALECVINKNKEMGVTPPDLPK